MSRRAKVMLLLSPVDWRDGRSFEKCGGESERACKQLRMAGVGGATGSDTDVLDVIS